MNDKLIDPAPFSTIVCKKNDSSGLRYMSYVPVGHDTWMWLDKIDEVFLSPQTVDKEYEVLFKINPEGMDADYEDANDWTKEVEAVGSNEGKRWGRGSSSMLQFTNWVRAWMHKCK